MNLLCKWISIKFCIQFDSKLSDKCFCYKLNYATEFKGTVHQKQKIVIICQNGHLDVVPNMYDFFVFQWDTILFYFELIVPLNQI